MKDLTPEEQNLLNMGIKEEELYNRLSWMTKPQLIRYAILLETSFRYMTNDRSPALIETQIDSLYKKALNHK